MCLPDTVRRYQSKRLTAAQGAAGPGGRGALAARACSAMRGSGRVPRRLTGYGSTPHARRRRAAPAAGSPGAACQPWAAAAGFPIPPPHPAAGCASGRTGVVRRGGAASARYARGARAGACAGHDLAPRDARRGGARRGGARRGSARRGGARRGLVQRAGPCRQRLRAEGPGGGEPRSRAPLPRSGAGSRPFRGRACSARGRQGAGRRARAGCARARRAGQACRARRAGRACVAGAGHPWPSMRYGPRPTWVGRLSGVGLDGVKAEPGGPGRLDGPDSVKEEPVRMGEG
jgi:hypothetical protein